jgi:hypothetical protein
MLAAGRTRLYGENHGGRTGDAGISVLHRLTSDTGVWIDRAPGTHIWLAVLLGTSLWVRRLDPVRRDRVLAANSTSLERLRRAPLLVLATSALFVAEGGWLFYAVLFTLFQAPAEHRLGTGRWLAVIAIAHVGATLLSQGYVGWAVRSGRLPRSTLTADDYGVSYALAGAIGVLTYRIDAPWRYVYLVVVLAYYLWDLLRTRDFTAIGHMCALLLGLACYLLVP